MSLFSDQEIAAALLETYPHRDHFWLSDEHIVETHRRLKERL